MHYRSTSEIKNRQAGTVSRETVEYVRLQLDKQRNFDCKVEEEAKYRRKTPERRNEHLMTGTLTYAFADFPASKVTPKITSTVVNDSYSRSLSHRRGQSYHGKQYTDITRTKILW